MRITIVSDVFGEENNGTNVATMNLYRHLISKGNKVSVLCAMQSKKGQEGFYVVPNLNVGPFNNYVKKVGVSLAKPQKDVVIEAFKDAEVVYIMIPLLLGIMSAKVAYEMNKPIIVGFHMQAENFSSHFHLQNVEFFNKKVYKFIYKHVYKYASAIHYPTEFIKNIFEKNINKITPGYIISNGINSFVQKKIVSKPKELEDKIVILSSGRYSREKDQITLLKAIRLSKYNDKIQVILAGAGPLEKKYRRYGKKLANEPILKFFTRSEMVDVLNYADFYIHTAVMELEGIACLEAISIGKMTLVSDSKKSATSEFAASPECIFKHRNPHDLAGKIDYFIEHKDEVLKLEEIYLSKASNYEEDKCMEKMNIMIEEVYKKHYGKR